MPLGVLLVATKASCFPLGHRHHCLPRRVDGHGFLQGAGGERRDLGEPVCLAAHVRGSLDAVQEVEDEDNLRHPQGERPQAGVAAGGASSKGGPLGHGLLYGMVWEPCE